MTDWKTFLFGLSIGLNIAFLVVWGFFVLEDTLERHGMVEDRDHRSKRWNEKKGHSPGWWFYHEKLDVNDQQWETIKPRLKEFHRSSYQLCKRIGQTRNELLALIGEDESAEEVIEQKKQKILDLRRQKQSMAVDYFSEKKDVLTTEQQKRFFDMLQQEPRCRKHARFLENTSNHHDWNGQTSPQ